jgi:hypothetical protein
VAALPVSHLEKHQHTPAKCYEGDQIIDLSPLRRKKKYNNAKNIMKGKLPKKPKTPSKIKIK